MISISFHGLNFLDRGMESIFLELLKNRNLDECELTRWLSYIFHNGNREIKVSPGMMEISGI